MNRTTRPLLLLWTSLLLLCCCPLITPPIVVDPPPAPVVVIPSPTPAPLQTPAPVVVLPIPTQAPLATPATANGQIARQHIVALSEGVGARPPGSPEEGAAAAYIVAAFEQLGYTTQVQRFSFTNYRTRLSSANVIAVKPGLSPREIIVGAHYDSVDVGQGADDNASGVAVMLEVAAMIRAVDTPFTIRFVAFGAEESGLHGSQYYVDQMSAAEIRDTVGMINLDSLIAGDIPYVYGDVGPGTIHHWILQMAQERGLWIDWRAARDLDEPDGTPCDCADYDAFQEAGIPFAYFEATNWNLGDGDGWTQVHPEFGENGTIWHTRYDTLDYLDRTFPGRVDQHLDLFVTLLYDTLTRFSTPR